MSTRFDTIQLEQIAKDRVKIFVTKGEPPPTTLKVAMNEVGGFRSDHAVALTGIDIEAKAKLVEAAFWASCEYGPEDYESVATRLVRTDKVDASTNEQATASWSITLKSPDERKVGRVVSNAVTELALASIPGMFVLNAGSNPVAFGVYRPAVVPAAMVPQHVVFLDGGETIVTSVVPNPPDVVVAPDLAAPDLTAPSGPTIPMPLGCLVGARSGDKGGNANLGVFARTKPAWAWLDAFLTVDKLRELLPETVPLVVDRYRFPALLSVNFVLHDLLGEGVASSTRQDAQAKSLGEWLRSRVVEIPESLLDEPVRRSDDQSC